MRRWKKAINRKIRFSFRTSGQFSPQNQRKAMGTRSGLSSKSYGADKLSAIDPSHYSEMLKEAEVFGSAS
jgi:hypothetical protein